MTKFKAGEYYLAFGENSHSNVKHVIIVTKRAKTVVYFTFMQKTLDDDIIVSENLKAKIRVKYGIEHFIWGESLIAPMFAASRTCDMAIQELIDCLEEVRSKYKIPPEKMKSSSEIIREDWGWLFPA